MNISKMARFETVWFKNVIFGGLEFLFKAKTSYLAKPQYITSIFGFLLRHINSAKFIF